VQSSHGVKAQSLGVDGISNRRFRRCAGHPGEDDVPGLVLIPAAAKQIEIPMIASGGFGDARACWPLWRSGRRINMGTRVFLCTVESCIIRTSRMHRRRRRARPELIFRSLHNHRSCGEQRGVA